MFQLANPYFQQLGSFARTLRAAFALCLLMVSSAADAQSRMIPNQPLTIVDNAPTGIFAELKQEAYFARKEFLYGEENYTNLYGRFKNYGSGTEWFHGVNIGAMTSLSVKNYRGAYLKELHFGIRQSEIDVLPTETTVGQKLLPWSKLDADWNLGLWQPMQRWDFLHPEQEGLTGVFLAWQGQYGSFVLFGSGVYQPEQGAFFKIENRHLTSSSPWFSEPADYAVITGAAPNAVINYTLNIPEFTDIILRASVGGLLTIGQIEEGGWVKVGYSYKPRNRLHLPFTGDVVVTEVDVQIYPRVEYHHIGSLDLGYTLKGEAGPTTLAVSGLYEDPVESTVETTVNRQILEPLTLVSPSIETTLKDFIFPTFRARSSYLKQLEGGMRAEGPLVTANTVPESFFGYRLDFTNAFELALTAGFLEDSEKKLEALVRWVEEFDQKASLLMVELRYEPSRVLSLRLGGDFLGSHAPETDETGLITKFRGNDRVMGGVAYAF